MINKKTITAVVVVLLAIGVAAIYLFINNSSDEPADGTPRQVEDPEVREIQGITAVDDLNDLVMLPGSGDFLITSFDESKIYVLDIDEFAISGDITYDYPHKMELPLYSGDAYISLGGGRIGRVSVDNFQSGGTVEVGDRPSEMDYDPSRGYLLVVNEYSNELSVIDTSVFEVVASVMVGAKPVDVVVGTTRDFAYVANDRDGSVSVVSLDGLNTVGTIYGVGRPSKLVLNAKTNQLLVLDRYNGKVVLVDQSTNKVVGKIDSVTYPLDAVLDPDRNLLYVASFTDNTVGIINLDSQQLIERVRLGSAFDSKGGLNNIALTKDKNSLVVTNTNKGQVFLVKLR